MKVYSTDFIPGYELETALGLVRGNTIRAKHIGRDIMAVFKSIIGGEIKSYTTALTDARNEATERMIEEAQKLDADAIICVRYATSQVMPGAAEILVYGTAVKIKPNA